MHEHVDDKLYQNLPYGSSTQMIELSDLVLQRIGDPSFLLLHDKFSYIILDMLCVGLAAEVSGFWQCKFTDKSEIVRIAQKFMHISHFSFNFLNDAKCLTSHNLTLWSIV